MKPQSQVIDMTALGMKVGVLQTDANTDGQSLDLH